MSTTTDAGISIVGLGVTLPGADNKVEFFDMLKNKRSGIGSVPTDRWNIAKYTDDGAVPGKICTDRAGFISNINDLDNLEFGIAPNEVADMDPHQRVLLRTVLQALEDSGTAYRGSNCGVFVAGSQDAFNITREGEETGAYAATGAALSVQANRVSYFFDLSGPSIYVDTACSGGITAVHMARNSMLVGDCDTAVVCGLSLILTPNASQSFSKLGTLSPDGVCRAFSADANGYVRGEGCAVVVLKRTEAALRDSNHIYAEIAGSAINANGRGTSLTMPEASMQMAATQTAYLRSGRSPLDAVYVECHGTGTNVGDPIEANGVGQVFSPGRTDDDRLPIGSVKTNVGHLETGAGVVGLVKAALSLDAGLLLPSLNFSKPNPKIKWDQLKIKVQTETEPFPASKLTPDGKFVVSVSSFGFGGANSHLVLERTPRAAAPAPCPLQESDPLLMAVGGMTTKSMGNVADNFKPAFASAADVHSAALLSRIVTERARGHSVMSYAITQFGKEVKFGEHKLLTPQDLNPLKLFVFSGQGPQHDEMGRKLYARYPVFRASIERSDAVLQKHLGGTSFIAHHGFFRPAAKTSIPGNGEWPVQFIVIGIAMFQMALFDLWKSVGLAPDAVMGHSVGEIAAMYASGAITQEQAVRLAVARSHALATLHTVNGSMAALGVSPDKAQGLLRDVLAQHGLDDGLWISAHNSVNAVSVSGKEALIVALVEEAQKRDIFARQLRVGGPYHSPLVDICEAPFRAEVEPLLEVTENVPSCTFISTVEGGVYDKPLGAQYCWDNVRKPVLFKPALDAFHALARQQERNAVIVEVAPHGVLSAYIDEITGAAQDGVEEAKPVTSVFSARRPNKKLGETADTPAEVLQFLDAAGKVLQAGVRGLNICALQGLPADDGEIGYNAGKLADFPLQKIHHDYTEDPVGRHRRLAYTAKPLGLHLFRMSPKTHPWTRGHKIRDAIVVPGAAYLESAFEQGARTLRNVRIHRALVLDEDSKPKYCGFRTTGVNGQWQFRSSSKSTVNDDGMLLDVLHASGEMYPDPLTTGPKDADEMLGKDFMRDFDLEMDADQFYNKIYNTGSIYTGDFAMVTKPRASSKRDRDYLVELDASQDLWSTKQAEGMVIHPGLLDSMLQATWALCFSFDDSNRMTRDTYMPVGFEQVSLLCTPEQLHATKRMVIHFINQSANEFYARHDITLFDRDTGRSLIMIRNLQSDRVQDGRLEPTAYTETWEPRWLDLHNDEAPELQLDEAEAAKALSALSLAPAASRFAVEAHDNVQSLYAQAEVKQPLFECAAALVKDIIRQAAAAEPARHVIRILEVYAHQKKLKLSSLQPFAEKLGVHLDVVLLNVAKGQETAPFDLRASIDAASERVRPASFDVIFGVDVLRQFVSAAQTSDALDELLVPGGVKALAELSTNNAALFAGAHGGDATMRNDAHRIKTWSLVSGEVHTITVARRTASWLASDDLADSVSTASQSESGRNDDDDDDDDGTSDYTPASTPAMSEKDVPAFDGHAQTALEDKLSATAAAKTSAVRFVDASTIVYRYRPDTEMQLVEAMHALGSTPQGTVWIECDDTPDGSRGLALAGTLQNELVGITAYGVAFGASLSRPQRASFLDELMGLAKTGAVEPTTLIAGADEVYQRRIVKAPAIEARASDGDWVLDLSNKTPTASIDGLRPHKYLQPALRNDDVLIRTDFVALNFKNVLSATGLLPAHDRLSEFAGVVVATGPDAKRFQPGDRVMGSSNVEREGTVSVAGEKTLTQVPDTMGLQEAAAFPISYGTVWHGLMQLARLERDETVLIHSAAGSVGLSAIQIAQRAGAKVFCTVGSQDKRDYLHKNFGVPYENMSDSRNIAQWQGDGKRWLSAHGKQDGFDVVLNSLQGAALQAGLDSLGYLGRFVDISKRDHLAGSPMSMRHFAKVISYFAVELGMLSHKHPRRMTELMQAVCDEHTRQPFHHIIGHHFSGPTGLTDAYALMETGKHIGKIVVDLTDASATNRAATAVLPPKRAYDPRKSYVLVGGCGGLGPRLAMSMVVNGARNILLTGRRGKLDMAETRCLNGMKREPMYAGLQIETASADALNDDDMQRVFRQANEMAPLGGVFLMAVRLADDQFVNMDERKFKQVTDSKIGALNVVERLVDVPKLDFLFLFSSTAALYYNPGQSNYNAAQGYFNRLAVERRNVISFAVPAISDVGVFAELLEAKGNTAATKSMLSLACTSRELCDRIADSVQRTTTGQAVPYYIPDNLDWNTSYKIAEACRPAFAHLAEHDDEDNAEQADDGDLDPVLVLLSKLLNLEPDAIEDAAFLSSLGLDSLSASRLSALLGSEFGVKMTQLQLLGPVTVAALRTVVGAATEGGEGGGASSASTAGKKGGAAASTEGTVAKTLIEATTVDYAADLDKFDADIDDGSVLPFDVTTINADNAALHVLVTGASGMLGSSALVAVLQALPKSRVTALLRGTSAVQATQRMRAKFASLNHDVSALDRVNVVLGDVTKPNLGLSTGEWNRLNSGVDVIVQAHGKADHVAGYQELVQANAYSTSQVLKLAGASATKAKAVVYFGSTNMWSVRAGTVDADQPGNVSEDFDLGTLATGIDGGYAQSKWVSESLVLRARARGQTAMIVRPGNLGGRVGGAQDAGAVKLDAQQFANGRDQDSFMSRIMRGCAQFGFAPQFDANFSETPVDWFATIVGRLLCTPGAWDAAHPALHVRNPNSLTFDKFNAQGESPWKMLPLDEWRSKFVEHLDTPQGSDNPMAPMIGLFDTVAKLPSFSMDRTRAVLADRFVEAPQVV